VETVFSQRDQLPYFFFDKKESEKFNQIFLKNVTLHLNPLIKSKLEIAFENEAELRAFQKNVFKLQYFLRVYEEHKGVEIFQFNSVFFKLKKNLEQKKLFFFENMKKH
jgi:hypothetical protein